jgi:hypothetical protein
MGAEAFPPPLSLDNPNLRHNLPALVSSFIGREAELAGALLRGCPNLALCPLTEDPVFTPGTVQSCLSMMSSCGLYDFFGEFAFTIGLPAKSGVSGAVMLVIPGLMGIAVWSPRLDERWTASSRSGRSPRLCGASATRTGHGQCTTASAQVKARGCESTRAAERCRDRQAA